MGRAWMTEAPCLDPDAAIEFMERPAAAQKAVCNTCPRWVECLDYAIETKATGVVMGGIEIGIKPLRKVERKGAENEPTSA